MLNDCSVCYSFFKCLTCLFCVKSFLLPHIFCSQWKQNITHFKHNYVFCLLLIRYLKVLCLHFSMNLTSCSAYFKITANIFTDKSSKVHSAKGYYSRNATKYQFTKPQPLKDFFVVQIPIVYEFRHLVSVIKGVCVSE